MARGGPARGSLLLILCFLGPLAHAFWKHSDKRHFDDVSGTDTPWVRPLRGAHMELDFDLIQQALDTHGSIWLPFPDGSRHEFTTWESHVVHPDLASQLADVYTFRIRSVNNSDIYGNGDYAATYFHAQIFTPDGTFYIDPYTRGNRQMYTSHWLRDLPAIPRVRCVGKFHGGNQGAFHPNALSPETIDYRRTVETLGGRGTNVHITLRLAVATSVEYTNYFGSVDAALAQVVVTTNRVCGIWERELGISLQLVPNNRLLIFSSTSQYVSSKPLSNTNGLTNINNAGANMNAKLGVAGYDIGHVLSTGQGGGVAYIGVVCNDQYKAGGSSGVTTPTGDGFGAQVIAHEMGHSAGADHTFNGKAGYCSPDQYGMGLEPGCGSTIMSYAGLCGADNIVSTSSEDYYHSYTLHKIMDYMFAGSGRGCGTRAASTRALPTVSVPSNAYLPRSTPFVMQCSATSSSSNPLYYNWEEVDIDRTQNSLNAPTGDAPIFRSVYPSLTGNVRFFPRLSAITSGIPFLGELLPTYTRTLTLRCTARDRAGSAAQVNTGDFGVFGDADVVLSVSGTAGPFQVTYPTGNSITINGNSFTVTWDVANTNAAPISVSQVNIFLSTDGGTTWFGRTPDAAGVPNTGSYLFTVPAGTPTTRNARIIVQAVHPTNFYDMSDFNFYVAAPAPSCPCTNPPPCHTTVGVTCPSNVCNYPITSGSCSIGIDSGVCVSGNCVTCATLPVPCSSTLPSPCYDVAAASCVQGQCKYSQTFLTFNSPCAAAVSGKMGYCDVSHTCVTCDNANCDANAPVCQTTSSCADGVCAYGPATPNTACTANAKTGYCDNGGNCVTCPQTCATPPNACYSAQGSCTNGKCSYTPLGRTASCTAPDGNPGKCDGSGNCVNCNSPVALACNSPPQGACQGAGTCDLTASASGFCVYPTACSTPPTCYRTPGTCTGGKCVYTALPVTTACTTSDSQSGQCDGQGNCLACSGSTAPTCNSPTRTCQATPGSCVQPTVVGGARCVYANAALNADCTTGGMPGHCDASLTCVTCASQCLSPPVCYTSAAATCSAGNCGYVTKAAAGTRCTVSNEVGACDANANCVLCSSNPCKPTSCQSATCSNGVCSYFSSCSVAPTCQTAPGTCINGQCVFASAPSTTVCGRTGVAPTAWCSAGSCVQCATSACAGTPPTCKATANSYCSSPTSCVWANAALNAACTISPTGVSGLCDGSGKCLACTCAPIQCKRASRCQLTISRSMLCTYVNEPVGTACSTTMTSRVDGTCSSSQKCCLAKGSVCFSNTICCSGACNRVCL